MNYDQLTPCLRQAGDIAEVKLLKITFTELKIDGVKLSR
ncbi:hypothetical protein SAMN06265379_101552 [Saccharicrinis carchari]|uniref:Uncharacterized protein n=1 Tax=Saccharicrinis carchari TaxID=1168039 RepID=A0A521B010_SACCC|nr:hypothetical protein SAMN06265379_101552 [Saccharicrinis carchari]